MSDLMELIREYKKEATKRDIEELTEEVQQIFAEDGSCSSKVKTRIMALLREKIKLNQ